MAPLPALPRRIILTSISSCLLSASQPGVHLVLSKVLDHDKEARHQCTYSFYEIPPDFFVAKEANEASKETSTAADGQESAAPPPPPPPRHRHYNFFLAILPKVAFKVSSSTRALDSSSRTILPFVESKISLKHALFPLALDNPVDLLKVLRLKKNRLNLTSF